MNPSSRQELEALVRRHVEAENAHRLDETVATFHPDCLFEDMALGRVYRGHEGARSYYRMWWEGLSIVLAPAKDDRQSWTENGCYVAETSFTGVHTGPFLGLAPTGRKVHFRFAVFVAFREGLMAGERFYYDLDGLLRQLGAVRPALAA